MRNPIPSHGNLDHWYLKPMAPIPPTTNTFSAGTPAEYRETLRLAIQAIDAINHKQPLTIPIEDIEL